MRPTRCTSRCRRSARGRSSSSPTRTSTRSRRRSRRRSSRIPRPRRICRSSPRSTWHAARWSSKATSWSHGRSSSIEARRQINGHPLISKYFRVATPAEMIPAEYRKSGFTDWGAAGWTMADTIAALDNDEFYLDPTRITLLCGAAGYDGTQFKGVLASEHDIQINKTSRNSVLVQININNTRSDLAHLIKALADMARAIDTRLAQGGEEERAAFRARVKSLVEDVPDLPDFQRFHDAFRDDPKSATQEGHMREAYYMAYDAANCEYEKLDSKTVDDRLAKGPELVSAKFVIPYPPGFPIMVPGQVVTKEIITFMRKLDVKEIHGYDARKGLELLKPDALTKHK